MNLLKNEALLLSVIYTLISPARAAHAELGEVTWLRNYDQAVEVSKQSGKAILILFQKVPGCSGCVAYGKETLSHKAHQGTKPNR